MGLIQDTIVAEIVERFEAAKKRGLTDSQSYQHVADKMSIDAASVRHHITALRSTVFLAKRKLLAKASVMVDRIVEKAPTSELIDILSRPSIGVLEPAQKGTQGNGGFILSVGMDSLGGVRATAAMLPTMPAPQLSETLDSLPDISDVEGAVDAEEHAARNADAVRELRTERVDSIKERLALARLGAGPEDEAVPAVEPDTDAEGRHRLSGTPWLVREGDSRDGGL